MRHRSYVRDGALCVLPDPASVDDERVRLALLLRNEATLTGVCPACGARGPNRAERRRLAREHRGELVVRAVWHAAECPAGDDRLAELMREAGDAA